MSKKLLEQIESVLEEGKFDKIDKKDLATMGNILSQQMKGDAVKNITPAERERLYSLFDKWNISYDKDKKTLDPKFKKYALDAFRK